MAKKPEEKKLDLVPAVPGSLSVAPVSRLSAKFDPAVLSKLKGLKKLTLPPLVKPEQVPVGGMIEAKIIALVGSISKKENMKNSKLMHLQAPDGTEFLFSLTGVIKKAIGGEEGVTANVGKTLILVRQEDGSTEEYGGKKRVFMFDVYLA